MSYAKIIVRKLADELSTVPMLPAAINIYRRYRTYTMIYPNIYVSNLLLCAKLAPAGGCVVEAGVWRGGMSAGIGDMLPGRLHYLFDSFEGLPPAKEIDGKAALSWQSNVGEPGYYDNCRAERSFAEHAM